MSQSIPPWDLLGFTFGTEPEVLSSVPRCSNITVDYYNNIGTNKVANPPPTAPYSIWVYAGGYQPLEVSLNNSATQGQYRWRMNLPAGQTYGVSMKDAKGYSGGILTPMLGVVPGTNCNVASPLQTSTLDVSVSGNSQCGQAILAVNNGTAPYTVEVVPADNRQQKTIHFQTSPFGITLDISAGVEYFLSVSDSAGHSNVLGKYTVGSSSVNDCLGAATTVSAGRFSTVYPGGTAVPTSTGSSSSGSPKKLATGAIVGIAVAVPIVAILALLLLWYFFRRNRRQHQRDAGNKPEIDEFDDPDPNVQGGYTPVPTSNFGSIPNTGSYHDFSSAAGSQRHMMAVPYPQTIATSDGAESSIGAPTTTTRMSEKRRQMLNPDSHGLGPIAAEPFDPHAGGESSHSGMPPLPPAYSASPSQP